MSPHNIKVNPLVAKLRPYQPGMHINALQTSTRSQQVIKLASNENPFGASPEALACLQKHTNLARYPDSDAKLLRNKLADKLNIPQEYLMLGNGSDELFRLITQTFVTSTTETLAYPEYSFAGHVIACQLSLGQPIMCPAKNYQTNLDELAKQAEQGAKIVFLANPNNPTGTWINKHQLQGLLAQIPATTLLVLDEAYYEFGCQHEAYPDSLQLLQQYPNLIITRTFSKAYGLAGLRLGYAIAHPMILDELHKARLPFNVNALAQEAACEALADTTFLKQCLDTNQKEHARLTSFFISKGLRNLAEIGNFVTIELHEDATPLYQSLLQQGVITRLLHPYKMDNFLRISVGTPEENNLLLKALPLTLPS